MFWYNHSFAIMCLLIGTVSGVSNVTHGPLVFFHLLVCIGGSRTDALGVLKMEKCAILPVIKVFSFQIVFSQ